MESNKLNAGTHNKFFAPFLHIAPNAVDFGNEYEKSVLVSAFV